MRVSPLAAALALQGALGFAALGLLPVWGDEQFSLDAAALGWPELPQALRRDIHPPLYFGLLKLWMATGAALGFDGVAWARALSVVALLGTTALFDRLWLRGGDEGVRRWTLALWAAAPGVLLYGRMARSYALQTLLAVWALHEAYLLVRDGGRARAARFAVAAALLLYTHYLPGVAVLAATAFAAVWEAWRRREPRAAGLAAAGVAGALALYAPWLAALADGVGRTAVKPVYSLTANPAAEIGVRAGYWGLSALFGEAHTLASVAAAGLLAPVLAACWARGLRAAPEPLAALWAAGAAVGFAGVAAWASFPFVPARMLWAAPWAFLWIVQGARRRAGLAAWLALAIVGCGMYVARAGFLNKGYLIPYATIAARTPGALTIADATNSDPSPLLARTGQAAAVVVVRGKESFAEAAAALADPAVERFIHARAARDISPGRVHERIEALAAENFETERTELLPYSTLDRLLLRLVTGEEPPSHHFVVVEGRRRAAP